MAKVDQDHRTLVGLQRREKMQRRLIESALVVFSQKGIDGAVIDDVISEAGVARGTFYNYFKTTTELVIAVGEILSNELVDVIETQVRDLEDPVEILATGLRLFLHTAQQSPVYARFMSRAGMNVNAAGHLIFQYLPNHIMRAMGSGGLQVRDGATALESIVGIMLGACYGISNRATGAAYADEMVTYALRALGVTDATISQLLQLALPTITLPEDSLLAAMNRKAL